jgi:hypothetical protein
MKIQNGQLCVARFFGICTTKKGFTTVVTVGSDALVAPINRSDDRTKTDDGQGVGAIRSDEGVTPYDD